jgi:hypothetical protein
MHFHLGEVGVSGAVQVGVDGPYTSGMTGSLTLTDDQENDLLANKWYLNMHTTEFPAGEIRGQVVPENFVVFSNITLSGQQESPANDSESDGVFNALYDKTTKTLSYNATIEGFTPSAMHLHKADVGVSGPVVIPIATLSGTTEAFTSEQEADLLGGNLYFNAHSTAFPAGEIRGQVVTDDVIIFANVISGDNEVEPTGSNATGSFYGAFTRSTGELAYTIHFTGLTPTAMHFHKAAAGENGDVVVPISAPYTSGMTGSVMLTGEQESDLLAELWYINIHSADFPGGEIRAQLVRQ